MATRNCRRRVLFRAGGSFDDWPMWTNLWPVVPAGSTGNEAVRFIAERQVGLIATRQAIAVGVSRGMIERHRQHGRWVRVAPAVSAVGCRPSTFEGELAAALLWAGPDAAAAGGSAARLWGLDGATAKIEIVVGYRRTPRRPGVVVHRSLDPSDVTRRRGFPVTGVRRTLLDACATRPREEAADLVDEAIRRGHTTSASLVRYGSRRATQGRPEVGRLCALAHELEARTESAFERRALDLVRRFGLPEPHRQTPFTWDGRALRADFAWPAADLVLECDGFAFHRTRQHLGRDRWRRRAFAALGQQVVWITWEDVRDAAAFAPIAADLAARIARAADR